MRAGAVGTSISILAASEHAEHPTSLIIYSSRRTAMASLTCSAFFLAVSMSIVDD